MEGQGLQEVWTSSGGHTMEEEDQGAMDGEGASSGEMGLEKGYGETRWSETGCTTEVDNGQRHGRRGALVAPCYV